jgi:tetratricopeptide (TPR) repeat protein
MFCFQGKGASSLVILLISLNLWAQELENPVALGLFIEGKTLELQNNYLGAIQKYNEALKIEKAAGIYYTLSQLYSNTSQYQKAIDNALTAIKLAPDNLEYKESASDIYIMLNDYSNALKMLMEVSKKRPDDINVLYNIGRLYEAEKQPSEAIKYYERITEEYTYDESVLRRMITIYENYKDYANEASAMEKLLIMDPANLELKVLAAQTFLRVPDYQKALELYESILETDPKNREVQTEVIKIYFRQNRNDIAFEKYGQLINRDTVDFMTKMGIALAFFEAAKEDSTAMYVARSILETVQSSYQNEWMPQFYLALIEMRESSLPDIEDKLKRILTDADTSAEAHVQVGFVYFEQNKFEDAARIFGQGAGKFPENFRLNYLAGLSYYRMGKNKEAYPYLEAALEISPSDINVLSALGLVYDDLKMDAECERIYEQALKYHPENILIMNNYAYHLAERGKRLKEAEEMSRKTIEAEPESSSYLDTYGWILFRLKDYKNAAKYIEKAVRIRSDAVLLEHLGDVYEAMGEIVKAVKYWKQGLDKDPENERLRKRIEKYE